MESLGLLLGQHLFTDRARENRSTEGNEQAPEISLNKYQCRNSYLQPFFMNETGLRVAATAALL